jgi:hypothetical protein
MNEKQKSSKIAKWGTGAKGARRTPVPVHSCADANNSGERVMHLGLYAGPAYQDTAAPVIQEQIALAGVRLAMILNDAAKSLAASN